MGGKGGEDCDGKEIKVGEGREIENWRKKWSEVWRGEE